jgi:hypothetical protein
MHQFKVRFIDSQSTTSAEMDLHAIPREGETIRFRTGAGSETTLTVKAVTYTLADPSDPPLDKETCDAVLVLGLTAVGEVAIAPPPAVAAIQ